MYSSIFYKRGTGLDRSGCMQSRLSLWEVAFSSFLHPERRPPSASGAEARMHHRAALFNSQHELTHVVSQTDVVRSLLRGRSAGSPHVARSLGVRMLDVPGVHALSASALRAMSQPLLFACRSGDASHLPARRAFAVSAGRCRVSVAVTAARMSLLFVVDHRHLRSVPQGHVVTQPRRCVGSSVGAVFHHLSPPLASCAGLCSTSIVSVTADTSALDAIALMRRHGLSAVPIVAAGSGVLRGTFGLGALRRVMAEQFAALALPVGDFLSLPAGSAEGSANGGTLLASSHCMRPCL